MLREIKFRFWNGSKMDYEGEDASIWHGVLVCEGDTISMQFTGLKDKNGKEIYEGDLVEHHVMYRGNLVETVKWERHGWRPFWGGGDGHYMPANPIPEYCEVIGNVYENKELVKE